MSKLTDLRRKAAEAARAKNWSVAIQLYERLCGHDSSNGSIRNELGDVFLKSGDVPRALESFTAAGKLYLSVELTNNAVAVLKKVLRHDPDHLESLWQLAQIRLGQGLEADAARNVNAFLDRAPRVNDRTREFFLARCQDLLEGAGEDVELLDRLEHIYTGWKMPHEQARCAMAKALAAREAGEDDIAERYVGRARELVAELASLPEFGRWERPAGDAPAARGSVEPGVVDLGATPVGSPEPGVVEIDATGEIELEDIDLDAGDEPDSDIEIEIDLDDAAGEITGGPTQPRGKRSAFEPGLVDLDAAEPEAPADEAAADEAAPAGDGGSAEGQDFLDALLGDDSGIDREETDQSQVDTIARDVAGQLGGDIAPDDFEGHYQVGLVFIDMGLDDQALEPLRRAAEGEEIRLRALEMQGSCLRRLGRHQEALDAFQSGLKVPGHSGRSYLGLLYGTGATYEELGDGEKAREFFARVAETDPSFQDVRERLAQLAS